MRIKWRRGKDANSLEFPSGRRAGYKWIGQLSYAHCDEWQITVYPSNNLYIFGWWHIKQLADWMWVDLNWWEEWEKDREPDTGAMTTSLSNLKFVAHFLGNVRLDQRFYLSCQRFPFAAVCVWRGLRMETVEGWLPCRFCQQAKRLWKGVFPPDVLFENEVQTQS